jgi:hypothetical protein
VYAAKHTKRASIFLQRVDGPSLSSITGTQRGARLALGVLTLPLSIPVVTNFYNLLLTIDNIMTETPEPSYCTDPVSTLFESINDLCE